MNTLAADTDYATLFAPDTVHLERLLPGPIERVWAHLADGDLRRRWLAAGDMPAHAGGNFELVWRNDELTSPPGRKPEGFGEEHRMASTVTVFDPPHRLAFTWGPGDVTFTLEPRADQVLLTIVHRGISDHRNVLMIGPGWHAHADVLAARLADETPAPFWDQWTQLREEYRQRLGG